jgi:hypothetical protein
MGENEMAELESEFNHEFGVRKAVAGSSNFWKDLKVFSVSSH